MRHTFAADDSNPRDIWRSNDSSEMKARQSSDAIFRTIFFAAVFFLAVMTGAAAEKGAILTGKEAMGDWTRDAPGVMRKITVQDLPPPGSNALAINRAHYKSDPSGVPRFGLVAEDVAKVNPDLIVRDVDGQILSVRYDAVNAMLLNEFLKEHRKVQELEAPFGQQQKQIEVLTAGLQRVSAQLELSKPAPQTVAENQ